VAAAGLGIHMLPERARRSGHRRKECLDILPKQICATIPHKQIEAQIVADKGVCRVDLVVEPRLAV